MEAGVEKEEMTEEKTPPACPFIPEHLRSFVTIRRKRNAVEKNQQQQQQNHHHDQQNQQQQDLQDYNNQHQQDHDVDHCHHDDHLQLACGSESLFSQFDSTPPLPTRTPRLRHRSSGDGGGDGGDGHEVMVMMEMFRLSGDGGGGREVGCSVPLWVLSLPDMELRGALNALGVRAAPVVSSTRGLMQRLLLMRVVASASDCQSLAQAATPPSLTVCYSLEMRRALLTGLIPDCSEDEELVKSQFDSWTLTSRPRPRGRRRSMGRVRCIKNCFNYLLLDPRKLMAPSGGGEQGGEQFRIFVSSIFYVGKGSGNRPFHHLQEAMAHLHSPHIQPSQKVARVLSVWEAGRGVINIPCFHSSTSAESLTRESCIIDALGAKAIARGGINECI
ncbi:unnamed protein product [Lampetra fluviatilis]